MSQLIEPPNSVVLVVGRNDFTPPSTFDGSTCVATTDCIAIGVVSVDDAPTLVGFVAVPNQADLLPLGTFAIETDGTLSLRDVNNHEYERVSLAPGVVSVTIWGNDDSEPCELELVCGGVAEQTYCDWCYSPLTPAAREQSRAVGLDREESWACETCIRERRFEEPPGGWDHTYPWPLYPWPFKTQTNDGGN